jgi:hypothetical protein
VAAATSVRMSCLTSVAGIISSTPVFYEPPLAAQSVSPHSCAESQGLRVDPLQERMDPRRRHRHRWPRRTAPRRHRRERAPDQPLHAQPEAAVFPDQHLQLAPIPAQEDETVPGVGLVAKLVLDHRAQRVDAPPHVLRIPGHEDPPHPGEVQHPRPRHANAVANNAWARSGGTPAVNVHRRPDRVVNVIRRRRRRPRRRGDWTTTSMKPGIRASWAPDDGYEGGRRTDTERIRCAASPGDRVSSPRDGCEP